MPNEVVVVHAHGDDETLQTGLPIVHWLAAGWNVRQVTMTRGGVTAASLKLDGLGGPCGHPGHLYVHDPVFEEYPADLTPEQIGDARMRETAAALAAATLITPNAGVAHVGKVFHYIHDLPTGWGGPTTGQPPTPEGIAAAQAIIETYVQRFPAAAIHTMSPTDDHPDHAACGHALRNLQADPAYSAQLDDSMYFVSRLYWATTLGAYPADVLAEGPQWFPTNSRKAEYDDVARKMRDAFFIFDPTDGLLAVGGHQVPNQFARCFPAVGSGQNIAAVWHN